MKTAMYILLVLVCSTAIANGQLGRGRGCPNFCPEIYSPRCGFNGLCLRVFSNSCSLSIFNCRNYGAFIQVDLFLCRLAAEQRGRGRLRLC